MSAGSGVGGGGRVPTGRDYAPAGGEETPSPSGTTGTTSTTGTAGTTGTGEVAPGGTVENLATIKAKLEADLERSGVEVRPQGFTGPTSTSQGMTDADAELSTQVFTGNGVPTPYNANTTETLYRDIKGTPEFGRATGALNNFLANPTDANKAEFMKSMAPYAQQTNIMEVLYLVFRESIKETNEDKKYYLMKLQDYNAMGEQLSGYLHELADASRELGAKAAGAKYPEMEMTSQPVEIKQFDLTGLGADGKLHTTEVSSKRLDRTGLNETIKEVESMQETVRNKRQMASTAFQNFDQKANQLYNLLSSVMKAFNEMRSGTVRNML